jgi:hypothetical protein
MASHRWPDREGGHLMSEQNPVETAVQLARIEGKIDLQTNEVSHLRRAFEEQETRHQRDKADQKAEVAAMKAVVERKADREDFEKLDAAKADKEAFNELRGWIISGISVVVLSVLGAIVTLVLKTQGA